MPRYLTIVPHLPTDELERRYRAAREGVDRTHWQVLWLVARGRTCPAVAETVGYTVNWVRTLVNRYNAGGPAGVGDGRRASPGARPLLDGAGRDALRAALGGPAPDGGLWTSPQVAAWMAARLGRPVSPQRGWEALRSLGFTPQRPRPRETRADPVAQAAFKGGASRPRSTGSPRPTRPPR